jgi:hypothetical protein
LSPPFCSLILPYISDLDALDEDGFALWSVAVAETPATPFGMEFGERLPALLSAFFPEACVDDKAIVLSLLWFCQPWGRTRDVVGMSNLSENGLLVVSVCEPDTRLWEADFRRGKGGVVLGRPGPVFHVSMSRSTSVRTAGLSMDYNEV